MSVLSLKLLGRIHIVTTGVGVPPRLTAKGQSFVAHIGLSPEMRMTRQKLAGLLWPEFSEIRARKALSTEIWRVKSAIAQVADGLIETTVDDIGFSADRQVWVDVTEFSAMTQCVTSVLPQNASPEERKAMRAAVALYTADLCDGVDDESLVIARETLRARRDATLMFLMEAARAQNEWIEAIDTARILLALDPLQENVHRKLIRCFLDQGNRPMALRQFEDLRVILKRDLDTTPMPETCAVLTGQPCSNTTKRDRVLSSLVGDVEDIQQRLSKLHQTIAAQTV